MFETQRISKDYVLLDFLFDHAVYSCGRTFYFEQILTNENLAEGRSFIFNLLQPLTEKYGPTSIADSFWPKCITAKNAHHYLSPHHWNEKHGAGADVVFHDHVNCDRAPIDLCHEVDGSSQVFDRIITYTGSEFVCLSHRRAENRDRLRENVRVPGQKAQYVDHRDGPRSRRRRQNKQLAVRSDWRRSEGEGVGKSGNRLRAHHIRVGQYFVLLDFCRSVEGLRRGISTLPSISLREWNVPQVKIARMFAEVLDSIVKSYGRITTLRGIEPAELSEDEFSRLHRWNDSESSTHRLVFLVNREIEIDLLRSDLLNHEHVVSADPEEHDRSSLRVILEISGFEPALDWSSAQRLG